MPKVTIGMPVYNGEKYLRESLDALVSQSFRDFELIISDNASTDGSSDICMEYSKNDNRIKYVRQSTNFGAWANFKYVLNEAQGEFFMWSAADDIRSLDFVELNYNFLSVNSDYVASTCPNRFEDDTHDISFALNDNDNFKRYVKFFDYCWFSHGIFYSLIKREELKKCPLFKERDVFFAADWAIGIFIASRGKINLTDKGFTLFNAEGESKRPDHLKRLRTSYIEYFIPFYKLSIFVLRLIKQLSLIKRFRVMFILVRLNIKINFDRFKTRLKK